MVNNYRAHALSVCSWFSFSVLPHLYIVCKDMFCVIVELALKDEMLPWFQLLLLWYVTTNGSIFTAAYLLTQCVYTESFTR